MNETFAQATIGVSVPTPFLISTATRGFARRATMKSTDPVVEKIKSFNQLPQGWHFGDGGPIPLEVIDSALKWHCLLTEHGVTKIDASPSEFGSVLVAATLANHYTEIISEPDGKFTVTRDQRPERPTYCRGLSEAQVKALILQMAVESCNMFAGSIQASSFQNRENLGATRSRTIPAAIPQDFHWWNVAVS
jgi:hypothetical protein